MELRQIRYFIQVVKLKSVTKAARALNMAQPALSRHIHALEYQLRTPLFVRTARGVVPTEAGAKLATLGESLLGLVDQIREQVENSPEQIAGHVVIGMPQSVSGILAPAIIDYCQQNYPEISLRITEGLSIFLEEWLSQGKIDLAVLTRPTEVSAIEYTPLVREQMVLVGHPKRMPIGMTEIPFQDLASFPFVIADGFRKLIDPWATRLDMKLNYVIEVDSIVLIKELVTRGLAFSITPYGFVHKDVMNGTLGALPIVDPPITRDLVLAFNTRRTMSAAVKIVRQITTEQVVGLQLTSSRKVYAP
ncbi:MAG: LysR family transcriptional regulator [Beijerinckiaceae bacterium]|nr:LysR family transcriptional regulator [Beijerinckiaceae bacterium]